MIENLVQNTVKIMRKITCYIIKMLTATMEEGCPATVAMVTRGLRQLTAWACDVSEWRHRLLSFMSRVCLSVCVPGVLADTSFEQGGLTRTNSFCANWRQHVITTRARASYTRPPVNTLTASSDPADFVVNRLFMKLFKQQICRLL